MTSISSIGSAAASLSTHKIEELSSSTKQKLEALGIDYNDLSNYSYIVSAISKKALTVGVVGSIYGGLVALRYFSCCTG